MFLTTNKQMCLEVAPRPPEDKNNEKCTFFKKNDKKMLLTTNVKQNMFFGQKSKTILDKFL